MKFISVKMRTPGDEVMSMIFDPTTVNDKVKFEGKRGIPTMRIKAKGDKIRVKCVYTNGPTRDNGWIQGTYFRGSIRQRDGVTSVKGIIVTEPIFHLLLVALSAFFVVMCIRLGGFNPVPIILLGFSIFMMVGEYKKQAVIERYIYRALRKADEKYLYRIRREMLNEEENTDSDEPFSADSSEDFE